MNPRHTLFALVVTLIGFPAASAEFCVTDGNELAAALTQAENNIQNNHIKLVFGDYETFSSGFSYQNSMPNALTISGGWRLATNGNCVLPRIPLPASATRLNGIDDPVLTIAAGNANANITLSNLSILSNLEKGLTIKGFNSDGLAGDVMLDRIEFKELSGFPASALLIDSAGRVDVKNSLFNINWYEISYLASISTDSDEAIYFTNNTVANNFGDSMNSVTAVFLSNAGDGGVVAANNIFWNNQSTYDLVFDGINENHHLLYNLFEATTGHSGIEIGNLNVDPLLNVDLSLNNQSPAIDSGITPPDNNPNPPVEMNWIVGDLDLLANDRTLGLSTDMGAVEYTELIFYNGFE